MSEKQKDRKIWLAAAVLGLALTLFLTGINTVRLKRENREIQARLDREIQQGIASEVFRLHVIANSDKEADQKLKLQVKDRIVEYLQQKLKQDADLEETKELVLTHLQEIEEEAEKIVKEAGFTMRFRQQWRTPIFLTKLTEIVPFPQANTKH